MIGVMQQWPVLLVGSSGSGKTSLLRHLAAMTGNELLELPLSADMDTMDIVGGYEQADPQRLLNGLQHSFREALKAAIVEDSLPASLQRWSLLENETPEQSPFTEIEAFLKELTSATQKPERIWDHIFTQCSEVRQRLSQDMRARFEWSDGMLIQALETGKWLVLDNSNLCSSSVLDRLNSLMEPNGFLAINEHRMPDGSARIIRPHRDFRLFLTMDPRHGELSRAMRNRCLELYMPESSAEKVSIPSSDLLDSSLFRFQPLVKQAWSRVDAGIAESLLTISFDGLGFYDQDLLGSLPQQLDRGLLPAPQIASEILHKLVDHDVTGLQQSTAFKSSTLETYRECFSVLGYDAENLANTEVSKSYVNKRRDWKADGGFSDIVNSPHEQYNASFHCSKDTRFNHYTTTSCYSLGPLAPCAPIVVSTDSAETKAHRWKCQSIVKTGPIARGGQGSRLLKRCHSSTRWRVVSVSQGFEHDAKRTDRTSSQQSKSNS